MRNSNTDRRPGTRGTGRTGSSTGRSSSGYGRTSRGTSQGRPAGDRHYSAGEGSAEGSATDRPSRAPRKFSDRGGSPDRPSRAPKRFADRSEGGERTPRSFADRGERSDRPARAPRSFDRGDRPARSFDRGDRPARSFDRSDRPARSFDKGDGSDRPRPARSFDRGDRPARSFDRSDRPARSFDRGDGSDRPRPARSFDRGDRPARSFDRSDRPARSFDKGDGSDRPRPARSFDRGDRPARSFDRSDRPARSFDKGDGSDRPRPARSFDRGDGSDRPRPARSFDRGDRPARSFDRSDRPARSFDRGDGSDRPRPARSFDRSDRPARSFDRSDRPARSFDKDETPKKSFEDKDDSAEKLEGDTTSNYSSTEFKEEAPSRPQPQSYTPKPRQPRSASEEGVRLNKFIANSGICSRREADDYITAGLVSVNGAVITELGTRVYQNDTVKFNDEKIKGEEKVYILMNKPKDYVTTLSDPHAEKTVMDLIEGKCAERVYPVGRLDKATTGVLLLTNDGDLADKLSHPSFEKKKIYHVFLDINFKTTDFQTLLNGIQLDDGFIQADTLSYIDEDKSQVGIEIHSGRNRIVRRVFEHLGYKIKKLDRVYFAGLTKKNLRRGQWRFLTDQEIAMLKMSSFE